MIGVGVVGCGYWGPKVLRNFREAPETRVVSACDRQADRLARMSAQYPAIKATGEYEDLLRDPGIDAIAVATPVSTHYELALRALRAGKHVFLEKPMAATVDEAERLVEEADRCGLTLMVDHTFIYTGAVRQIRELVRSGALGNVYYYDSVRVNLGLFQHDVNVIWDLAVHDLAIIDCVLPRRPVAISAIRVGHVDGQPENMAYITLLFEGNLIAHVHVNWLAPVKVRRTLVGGSHRMIVYDDLEPSEKIKVYDKGVTLNADVERVYEMLVSYRTGDMWAPQLETTEALQVEVRHFLDCVRSGSIPESDGRAGLRIVRLLEAATRSMRERGRLVELQPEEVAT